MRKLQTVTLALTLTIMVSGCWLQRTYCTPSEEPPVTLPAENVVEENSLPTETESPSQRNLTPLNGKPERLRDIYAERVEPAPEPELPYTEEELEWLALIIYQEAGGDACSDDTRLKVGTVVMNRVADDRFPDTIEEVLTQKAQYGRLHWTGLVWPERASTEVEAHAVERAYKCAERILLGERFLPGDVVWQAEFIQGIEVVCEQEGFYFCR